MVSLFRSVRPSSSAISSPPPLFALLLLVLLLSALARARASMYVFIDVTRDSRTQLTARKHRMHRGYTSVFRARLWHLLFSESERRSGFLRGINFCCVTRLTARSSLGLAYPADESRWERDYKAAFSPTFEYFVYHIMSFSHFNVRPRTLNVSLENRDEGPYAIDITRPCLKPRSV